MPASDLQSMTLENHAADVLQRPDRSKEPLSNKPTEPFPDTTGLQSQLQRPVTFSRIRWAPLYVLRARLFRDRTVYTECQDHPQGTTHADCRSDSLWNAHGLDAWHLSLPLVRARPGGDALQLMTSVNSSIPALWPLIIGYVCWIHFIGQFSHCRPVARSLI